MKEYLKQDAIKGNIKKEASLFRVVATGIC